MLATTFVMDFLGNVNVFHGRIHGGMAEVGPFSLDLKTDSQGEPIPEHVVQSIVQSLRGLRNGQVTVIVQDGRVIQTDRMERRRFTGEKDARP